MPHAPTQPRAASTELVLRALAEPTRQRLMQLLISEEFNVSELVEILRQPQSTISRHLKVLREAGLVHDRRNGTTALYSAAQNDPESDELATLLSDWLTRRELPASLLTRLRRIRHRRKDETVGFFDRLGNRWDDLRSASFGEAFATEAFLALLPRNWTVADLGTGTGYLLPTLADNFRRVMAVEAAPAMLECARQRIAQRDARNVTLKHGELEHLPIRDQTCDLAIACLVLHHVAAPNEALAEMHRIVRPAGRILIVEQQSHENRDFYETMQDRWWGFEPAELARQVAAAGFQAVRHHPLATARGKPNSTDAPALFVITAQRAGPS